MKTVEQLKDSVERYFGLKFQNKPIPEDIQKDLEEYKKLVEAA